MAEGVGLLIAETSCEARNLFLNRALLVETMAEPRAAFLTSNQVPPIEKWAEGLPRVCLGIETTCRRKVSDFSILGGALAEGMRFELTVRLDAVQRFSKPPPSATRPPLRRRVHPRTILGMDSPDTAFAMNLVGTRSPSVKQQ